MSSIGPVEYMVVAFPGNQFQGEIGPALQELVDSGTVRIIDLAFVTKNAEGKVFTMELEELDDETGAVFRQFEPELSDLVNMEDLIAVAEELEPNSSAAVLVWEDLWASRLAIAIRNAHGVLLDLERIPHEVVEEALIAHRHWAYLAKKLGRDIAFGIIPVIVAIVVISLTGGFGGTFGTVAWIIIAAWLAFWAVKGYFTWYKYQNDVWVVTNQRLVDSMKKNWFNHQLASAALVNIQDMSVNQHGMLATAFHYGDLVCETAGSRQNFVLAGVPEPGDLLNLIDGAREKARYRGPASRGES